MGRDNSDGRGVVAQRRDRGVGGWLRYGAPGPGGVKDGNGASRRHRPAALEPTTFRGDARHGRVADELGLWKQAWSMVNGEPGARLLQLGYDWITSGSLGSYLDGQAPGRIHAVRSINTEIRACLPAGAYFLDMEQVSGAMGRDRFYDMRRYYWTRQPFSEEGTYRLATHLWAGICALTTGPKKALILDLDNTLWGGVVGETGPLGVALGDSPDGEAFRASRPISKISHGGASSLPSPPRIIPGMPGKSSRRTLI